MSRPVTEMDLRAPEFKHPDTKPEDLEFRGDGTIVRKDRWEMTCRRLVSVLGMSMNGNFELPDLIARVEHLMDVADPKAQCTAESGRDSCGWIGRASERNQVTRCPECGSDKTEVLLVDLEVLP